MTQQKLVSIYLNSEAYRIKGKRSPEQSHGVVQEHFGKLPSTGVGILYPYPLGWESPVKVKVVPGLLVGSLSFWENSSALPDDCGIFCDLSKRHSPGSFLGIKY